MVNPIDRAKRFFKDFETNLWSNVEVAKRNSGVYQKTLNRYNKEKKKEALAREAKKLKRH